MKKVSEVIFIVIFFMATGCKEPEQVPTAPDAFSQEPPRTAVVPEVALPNNESEEVLKARAEIEALRAALESAESDLDILLKELAGATERSAPPADWDGGPSFRLNNVEEGTYTVIDDVVSYSDDARIRLNGSVVSSPTGEMKSDALQTRFWGDLQFEEESEVRSATEIKIRREGNRVTMITTLQKPKRKDK